MADIDIVFDGPPSHESGRFVEVESTPGKSIRFGEWVHRKDGYWVLRFGLTALLPADAREIIAKVLHEDRCGLLCEKKRPPHERDFALADAVLAALGGKP